jgi:hypothetical protein
MRNDTPGYTSDLTQPDLAELICPPNPHDRRFCDDNIPTLSPNRASRIDYIFVSKPTAYQSFTLDFTRPQRLRLARDINAPGRDEIAFLSDHIGLMTTMLMSQT